MSRAIGRGASGGRPISRKRFLGFAGAATLLGGGALAGCGGGGEQEAGGAVGITFTFGPDASGGLQTLIDRFNGEHEGEIKVTWRTTPAASDEYFEQVKTQLQSGQATVDVIGGDVVWPAQLAAPGWVLDLSDRFTDDMKKRHLEGPLQATE